MMLIGFGKGCFIMAKAVDFAKIKADEGAAYAKPVQILDNDGNVVNKDLMANFTDDQLVDLMKKMVWERALHEQTMSFSQQIGRAHV